MDKRSHKYQSTGPEYVTGASFEMIFLFDFCTVLKIVICCSLIKCFPSNHKRYSSHLQVSLCQVVPIKLYLKFCHMLSYYSWQYVHVVIHLTCFCLHLVHAFEYLSFSIWNHEGMLISTNFTGLHLIAGSSSAGSDDVYGLTGPFCLTVIIWCWQLWNQCAQEFWAIQSFPVCFVG